MAGYSPLYIKQYETGLVQQRQNFILPNDAFPNLVNAYVWRERIKRKQGYQLLGRLRRVLLAQSLGTTLASPWTFNIFTTLTITETNAEIECGSVVITIQNGPDIVFTDQGDGTLTSPTMGNSGTINYITGNVTLTHTAGVGVATIINFNYFPTLPVMGLRQREIDSITLQQLVAFDQTYAYIFQSGGFQEFIPGTTWTGSDSNFFWTTNYWVTPTTSPLPNKKLFWATNFSGTTGDPIRYTEGTVWEDFAPQTDASGTKLEQCLALLPFRGRLVAFNTLEGVSLAAAAPFTKRIRWAAIGTPITVNTFLFPGATINANAWRDDIRGQGGFLDIPTNDDITSVGFVRDNLVIYCTNSTWQLRYTGRTIAPFQIEKVNTELGSESAFSGVQFDTSLVSIGPRGIVECDSGSAKRIDIKIPDLVFGINNLNDGTKRVHGIRDFINRLAYWTYPDPSDSPDLVFPNKRLVYNYENDSWAIFTDSLTTLGLFQRITSEQWQDAKYTWASATFPWVSRPALIPEIVGGNQQGWVETLDILETNDPSLTIRNIIGSNLLAPTQILSPNHNLETGDIISINNIPVGTPFALSLNGKKFGVVRVDANNIQLYVYNSVSGAFDIPQNDPPGVYVGCGQISVRDNFTITSKKFNFLDDGQNIQMGYLDVLMDDTESGAITLKVYLNYNDNEPINLSPQNGDYPDTPVDNFFNMTIPTTSQGGIQGSKNFQRVFCPVRGAFITIEWTLSNAQMVGVEQESDVQIDTHILWLRKAGRLQSGDF